MNHYRGLKGLKALQRHVAKEPCADAQALTDGTKNAAHYAYYNAAPYCLENNVVDRQNECPGWGTPAEKSVPGCVAMMYAEGPGTGAAHGHYNVLMNPVYTRLSCGVHIKPAAPPGSAAWIVLNFY